MIEKIYKFIPLTLLALLIISQFFFFEKKKIFQDYSYHNFELKLDNNSGIQHTYFGNVTRKTFNFNIINDKKNVKIFVGQPFVYSIKINNRLIGSLFGVGYIKYHSTYMLDRSEQYVDISKYLLKGDNIIEVTISVDCYCNTDNIYFKIKEDNILKFEEVLNNN